MTLIFDIPCQLEHMQYDIYRTKSVKFFSQIFERAFANSRKSLPILLQTLCCVYFCAKIQCWLFAEERKETKSLPQILKKYKNAIENILKMSVKNLWYFCQGGSPVY